MAYNWGVTPALAAAAGSPAPVAPTPQPIPTPAATTAPYADFFSMPKFGYTPNDGGDFQKSLSDWNANPIVQKYKNMGWIQDPTLTTNTDSNGGNVESLGSIYKSNGYGNLNGPWGGGGGIPRMGESAGIDNKLNALVKAGGSYQWNNTPLSSKDVSYNDPNYGKIYLHTISPQENGVNDPVWKYGPALVAGLASIPIGGALGLAAGGGMAGGLASTLGKLGLSWAMGGGRRINPYTLATGLAGSFLPSPLGMGLRLGSGFLTRGK